MQTIAIIIALVLIPLAVTAIVSAYIAIVQTLRGKGWG